jgi:glucose/arabinose dehydrogenase
MRAPNSLLDKGLRFCCTALVALLAACGGDGDGNPDQLPGLRLQQVGTALGLNFPLFMASPPGDTTRLFVVEKGGLIKIVNVATQQTLPTPFLDLSGQVATADEQGLLGLAFHPSYAANGFFYVNVVNLSGDSEIRRYQVSADPNVADPASVLLVLAVDQPAGQTNHKAGWLGFGLDGFLYAAFGDGGGVGDPGENAQNLDSHLGKILRINVDADDFPADATRNYAIPPNNPFFGLAAGLDEIWSFGLRNPWRPSFDRGTGDFYIADVGQARQEEVNVATLASGAGAGVNFGWDTMEGNLCFEPLAGCTMGGLAQPQLVYDHSQGCSITGGYVYRGGAIAGLQGTYFYGDFCTGFVRSFRFANGAVTEQTDWAALRPGSGITSFAEDSAGELYILTSAGGLFRIVP